MEAFGQTQIFYGNGKGKTTAALGTALRACGSGMSVHLIQFMKNGANSLTEQIPGEIKALKALSNFSFERFGLGDWYVRKKGEIDSNHYVAHRKCALDALNHTKDALFSSGYDLIIADEILYAVQLGLLNSQEVIEIIKSKPSGKELILTGSHVPFPEIFSLADLVTEVKKIKHPYDSGIIARKGIDF